MYAGLSMGIVLTFQGAGTINFAAAAMATVSLFVFNDCAPGGSHSRCRGLGPYEVGHLPDRWSR